MAGSRLCCVILELHSIRRERRKVGLCQCCEIELIYRVLLWEGRKIILCESCEIILICRIHVWEGRKVGLCECCEVERKR